MRSLSRFRNLNTLPGKMLLACSLFILAIVATEITVYGSTSDEMPPEVSASEVWVPADAVVSDLSPQAETISPYVKKVRSKVMQVDYKEVDYKKPVSHSSVRPSPALTDLQDSNLNSSDPGLIVPLEALGSTVQRESSYPPGTMVPGSMRVLQESTPVVVMTNESKQWRILPSGLLWHSYLAGPREPRISSTFFHIKGEQDYWDATVGGRVSLLRLGTSDPRSPEGVEVQLEGAAFPRLTLDYDRDIVASDYRFGFPLVYRRGSVEAKFSYYHLSAHLGDEYLIKHPAMIAKRINYSRDAFTLALGYFPWRDLRLYGEVGYAAWCDGGSRPWEFQFGVDYSPVHPTSVWGAPFVALNGHLHQELNYGGSLTAQAGVQWRGQTGRLLRFGFQYFNGMSEQYQFYRQFEQQIGGGIWYDF